MKTCNCMHRGVDYSIEEVEKGILIKFNKKSITSFVLKPVFNETKEMPRKKKKKIRRFIFGNLSKKEIKEIKKYWEDSKQ